MVSSDSTSRSIRSNIEETISQCATITDISAIRERLLSCITSPSSWQIQNRKAHLRPFARFFKQVLDPHATNPHVQELVRTLALNAVADQGGWPVDEIRDVPPQMDRRFNEPRDLIVPIFEVIFQDEELLRAWMRILDAHVEESSRATLQAMDEATRRRHRPIRKDVVIVGGGPLTSIVASVLGPYFQVTVITEQRGLGRPWRSRPLYINSSSNIRDFDGPGLPLLTGPTTRVVGSQQWNSLDVNLLLGTDTKKVTCDDGSVAEYVAGPLLGDLVANNILWAADDALVNQSVDLSLLSRNSDNSVRLVLVDTQDGTRRLLDASAVFLLTGPGPEQSKIPSALSQLLYRGVNAQLDERLAQAREQLMHDRALRQQEAPQSTFVEQAQLQAHQDQLVAQMLERDLPHILTLTMVEKIYEFWLEDLHASPTAFPLTSLVADENSVAYIGNGDTTRTLKELVEGRGPARAYPAGLKDRGVKKYSTIYNEQAATPEEYRQRNRKRYGEVFTPKTEAIPFKAARYRLLEDGKQVEVAHFDSEGKLIVRNFDYVFDATGLSRQPIEALLPTAFQMNAVRDLEGTTVARGDSEGVLFIAGSATCAGASDLPQEIQRIIEVLGISENTIALWVNGLLAERLAYTYAADHSPTKRLDFSSTGTNLHKTKKGSLLMSELLTVSEVARILRVDDTTVRRWVKQGALEAVILPHRNERQAYRIKQEIINKMLGEPVHQQK